MRLVALAAVLAACGGEPEPERVPAGLVLRPGDTILDHLNVLVVARWSPGVLPPDLAASAGPRRSIRAKDWNPKAAVPESYRPLLGVVGEVRAWRPRGSLDLALPPGPVTLRRDGVLLAPTDPVDEAPDTLVFWDEPSACVFLWSEKDARLFAVSETRPPAITIRPGGLAEDELLRYELDLADQVATPLRVELSRVSRPVLLAPAPSAIEVPIERLEGTALAVAIGIIDHEVGQPGDGASFTIEAVADGRTERLWSHTLPPRAVGAPFREAVVDLSAYTGGPVTLRLVTGPGPEGDRTLDYAVWGDLHVRGGATRPPARPHVVLIDVDTLRADALGCYGGPAGASPRIDAWAARRATVYRDAVAPAPFTLPSTASMLTGWAVHQHGVDRIPETLTPGTNPLALALGDVGYETLAITDGVYLLPTFGFDIGFDRFDCRRLPEPDWDPALRWVRERDSERPLFLFLQTYLVAPAFTRRTVSPRSSTTARALGATGSSIRSTINSTAGPIPSRCCRRPPTARTPRSATGTRTAGSTARPTTRCPAGRTRS